MIVINYFIVIMYIFHLVKPNKVGIVKKKSELHLFINIVKIEMSQCTMKIHNIF